MKAIITVGISGSGKTTWAEEKCRKDKNWVNINRDNIRFMLTGAGANGWNGYKFNKSIEAMVTSIQDDVLSAARAEGKNVIISDTNLNPHYRLGLVEGLKHSLGCEVEIKEFPIDLMEAIKRDRFRGNFSVGRDVIFKQWQQWLDYTGRKRYIPDENLPSAIIVDLDGTLADMKDVRGPFDWDKVGQDKVHTVVANMVYSLNVDNYSIIILSGRDGSCEMESRKWLDLNAIPYNEFFIREAGDNRKDSIIKEEIFWERIAPRYNVEAVVDDRSQVIRMWTDLGLKTIDVGNYYEEF